MSDTRNRTTLGAAAAVGLTAAAAAAVLTIDDPESPCTTPAQCAAYALCDSRDIPRAECTADEHGEPGAYALATRSIPYPCDLPAIVGEAEALTPNGQHVLSQRMVMPCDEADPLNSVVFRGTVRTPSISETATDRTEVVTLDYDKVPAGTCEITRSYTDDEGVERVDVYDLVRDRLPAGWTCATWIEGPFQVPARDVGGRSLVAKIIARGMGE